MGIRTDVLDGCPKALGMMMMIRSLSPEVIITDEIGREEDIYALEEALNSGISIITSVPVSYTHLVLDLCLEDDMLIPTVDFGHIHALGTGALNSMDDFEDIIIRIRNKLGKDSLKNLHCHFSRIEYTKAGEKKHWTYSHTQYLSLIHILP